MGGFEHEVHVFGRTRGTWRCLGGGGSGEGEDGLADRPTTDALGSQVRVTGSGWTRRHARRLLSRRHLGISYAQLQFSRDVVRVLAGERSLPVPRHGHLVVVWLGEQPRSVVPVLADGTTLAAVPLAISLLELGPH